MTERIKVGEAAIEVVADLGPLQKGLGQAKAATLDFQKVAETALGFGLGSILEGAGRAVGNFVRQGVRDFQQMERSLDTVVRNARKMGDASLDLRDRISDYADALQTTTRFQDTEAVDSLNNLLTHTRDLGQAMYLNNLAADVAAANNKSLASVSEQLGRALRGDERALMAISREYGIAGKAGETLGGILKDLEGRFNGAAAAEVGATAKAKSLGDAWSELGEDAGGLVSGPLMAVTESLTGIIRMMRGASGDELSSVLNGITEATRRANAIRGNIGTGGPKSLQAARNFELAREEALLVRLVARRNELTASTRNDSAEMQKAAAGIAERARKAEEEAGAKDRQAAAEKRLKETKEAEIEATKKLEEAEKTRYQGMLDDIKEVEDAARGFANTMVSIQANEMQTFFTALKQGSADAKGFFEAMGRAMLKSVLNAFGDMLIQEAVVYYTRAAVAAYYFNAQGALQGAASGSALAAAGGGLKAVAAGLKDGGVTIGGNTTSDTIPAMLRKNEAVIPLDDPRALEKLGGLGGMDVGGVHMHFHGVKGADDAMSAGRIKQASYHILTTLDEANRRRGQKSVRGRRINA